MKLIYCIIIIVLSSNLTAQVAIGKDSVDGSGILDFTANSNKGIILPWVSENRVEHIGSLIFDKVDNKVKVFDGNLWQDLSIKEGDLQSVELNSLSDTGIGGIIIGASASSRDGVLVLEDGSKALILPKSEKPWNNVVAPEPGTILYDPITKLICVYNGLEWTFWGI